MPLRPNTPLSRLQPPAGCHVLPFQCAIGLKALQVSTQSYTLILPTAHTSLGPLPQTPSKDKSTPVEGDHALPLQCRIVAVSPTAHTSLGPLPQTPWSSDVVKL